MISIVIGFYVFDASRRKGLRKAVGIDVVKEFIESCHNVPLALGDVNSQFRHASLEKFHARCMKSRQQFDITIFLGSYHYLYRGSVQCPLAYMYHDRILRTIADLTRKRVFFSGRLEVEYLADYPKRIAKDHPERDRYTTDVFLKQAARYFESEEKGRLRKSRLYVFDKKA